MILDAQKPKSPETDLTVADGLVRGPKNPPRIQLLGERFAHMVGMAALVVAGAACHPSHQTSVNSKPAKTPSAAAVDDRINAGKVVDLPHIKEAAVDKIGESPIANFNKQMQNLGLNWLEFQVTGNDGHLVDVIYDPGEAAVYQKLLIGQGALTADELETNLFQRNPAELPAVTNNLVSSIKEVYGVSIITDRLPPFKNMKAAVVEDSAKLLQAMNKSAVILNRFSKEVRGRYGKLDLYFVTDLKDGSGQAVSSLRDHNAIVLDIHQGLESLYGEIFACLDAATNTVADQQRAQEAAQNPGKDGAYSARGAWALLERPKTQKGQKRDLAFWVRYASVPENQKWYALLLDPAENDAVREQIATDVILKMKAEFFSGYFFNVATKQFTDKKLTIKDYQAVSLGMARYFGRWDTGGAMNADFWNNRQKKPDELLEHNRRARAGFSKMPVRVQ